MTRLHGRFLLASAIATLLAMAATAEQATTCTVVVRPAACLRAPDAITSCSEALKEDPSDVGVRLALCQAHLERGDLVESTVVLRRGREICGGGAACTTLRVALSNVEELSTRQSSDKQAELELQTRVDRGYCLGPSSNDSALKACKSVLVTRADDPAVYEALARKLLARRRPAEAVAALRGALGVGGDKTKLTLLVQDAQRERAKLSTACITGNLVGDCDDALLAGESDEIAIQVRRGDLLRKTGRNTAALQAYMAAQSRDVKNKDVARKVLDLVNAELKARPREADLLAARGDGYYALGELNMALESYQDAFQFGLADDGVRARMAAAREARATKVERECLHETSVEACNRLLLPGEPDEQAIRAHVASLVSDGNTAGADLTQEERRSPTTGSANVPIDTTTVVADTGVATGATKTEKTPRDAPTSSTSVAATDQPIGAATNVPAPDESLATTLYSNAASFDGTTH